MNLVAFNGEPGRDQRPPATDAATMRPRSDCKRYWVTRDTRDPNGNCGKIGFSLFISPPAQRHLTSNVEDIRMDNASINFKGTITLPAATIEQLRKIAFEKSKGNVLVLWTDLVRDAVFAKYGNPAPKQLIRIKGKQ